MESLKLNDRVRIIGRNLSGKIAYIGGTHASKGEWFGVILDEPKGRNNGCLDGRRYFKCPRNYGMFVRACQLEREGTTEGTREKIQYPNYLGVSSNSRAFFVDEEETVTSRKAKLESKLKHSKHSQVAALKTCKNNEKVESMSAGWKFRPIHRLSAKTSDKNVPYGSEQDISMSRTSEAFVMDPCSSYSLDDADLEDTVVAEENQESSVCLSVLQHDRNISMSDVCSGDGCTNLTTIHTNGNDPKLAENAKNTHEGSFLSRDASAERSISSVGDEDDQQRIKIMSGVNAPSKNAIKRLSSELQFARTQNVKLERELKLTKAKASKLSSELKIAENKYAKLLEDLRRSEKSENKMRRQVINAQKQALLLTKELRDTKKKLELSESSRNNLETEMEETKEVTEHAIVEKEIAGERIEHLESLLAEESEKYSHLEIEIEILKEEMQIQCIDGIPAFHLLRRLETENKVLRGALHHLKKLYDALHEEFLAAKRESDAKSCSITKLEETGKDLEKTISVHKMEISDLCDNMDSMLFVDEIVLQVTDRNLTYESQLQTLRSEVKDIEEQLEISDSIIETLESLKQITNEEKERLKFELRNTEDALEVEKLLVRSKQLIIEKYKDLTATLKHENARLSWELESARFQKQEAVVQAETLKMKNHRDERKRMEGVIEVENMRITIEVLKEKLNHLYQFLPDDIIDHNNTIKIIDSKLLASTLLKKVELFTKCLKSMLVELCDHTESEMFRTLAKGIEILEVALKLKSAFLQIGKKFDKMHMEELFYLDKNQRDLILLDSKLDGYLMSLTDNEFDRKVHLDNMQADLLRISHNFDLQTKKPCPNTDLENHLIASHISCKAQLAFCNSILAKKIGKDYSIHLKHLKTSIKAMEEKMRKLCNCLSIKEYGFVESDALRTLTKISNCLKESLNFIIEIYDSMDVGETFESFSFTPNTKHEMLKETVLTLKRCQSELEIFVRTECIFSSQDVKNNKLPVIETWAKAIKQKEKDAISNLKHRILSLELQQCKQAQELLRARALASRYKNEIEDLKKTPRNTLKAKGDDPPEISNAKDSPCSGDCSSTRKYATLKLVDLENSVRFLSKKNWDLKLQQSRTLQNCLQPLKVVPKTKYHDETESVRWLQKRLDELLTKLTPLLVPRVIDIAGKKEGKDKYRDYLVERALTRKGIEEEMWRVARDIKRLKSHQRVFGKWVCDSL